MAPVVAVPLFVASLAVTLLAARFFAQRLDTIGTRFGLPEAMIGLLTAVAADGPEISSATGCRLPRRAPAGPVASQGDPT